MLWSQAFFLMAQDVYLSSSHKVKHQGFPTTRKEIGIPTVFKGHILKVTYFLLIFILLVRICHVTTPSYKGMLKNIVCISDHMPS